MKENFMIEGDYDTQSALLFQSSNQRAARCCVQKIKICFSLTCSSVFLEVRLEAVGGTAASSSMVFQLCLLWQKEVLQLQSS